jgi:hypothetical protein
MFGLPGDFNLGFLDVVEDHPKIDWVGNWYACIAVEQIVYLITHLVMNSTLRMPPMATPESKKLP